MIAAGALTVGCAAAVGFLLVPGSVPAPPASWKRTPSSRASWRWAVLVCPVALIALLPGGRVVLAAIVGGSGLDVARRLRRRRAQRHAAQTRSEVLAACESLAGDVRAGVPPVAALRAATACWPALETVATAAELDADIPAMLRGIGAHDGAEQACTIAAAWHLAHRTGAGLAASLDLAARTIRDRQSVADVVATEIASARATAALLAVLPVAVLLLGQGIGGNPWAFLTGTPVGLFCLGSGLALVHAGLAWLDAITDGLLR